MADFDLSMVIRGDGSSAAAAATQVETSLDSVDKAQRDSARSARDMSSATESAAKAQRDAGRAATEAATATNALGTAEDQLAREFNEVRAAATAAAGGVAAGAKAQRDAAKAANDNAAAQNRAAFGARNLGQQVGDFATQVSLGGGVIRAFSSQIGQMGFAASEMGGKIGAVGRFLTGPWGIALTVGALVAAPFVEKLFDGAKAADEQADKLDKAATAADSYGTAQSLLGRVIDLTTGKMKTQNGVLVESIKLLAQQRLLDAQSKLDALQPKKPIKIAAPSAITGTGAGRSIEGSIDAAVRNDAQGKTVEEIRAQLVKFASADVTSDNSANFAAQMSAGLKAANLELDRMARAGKVAGRSLIDVKKEFNDIGTIALDKAAAVDSISALNGGPIAEALKPYQAPKKPRKPKSTAARDEFGRDAESKIANIVGQFGSDPDGSVLEKTAKQIRALDDLIDDLGRKKPPNFAELINQAEQAKFVIRDGLIRDVAEGFDKPKTLADRAALAVRQLNAVILDLNKNKPQGFEKLLASANAAKGSIRDGLQRPYEEFVRQQQEGLAVQQLLTEGRVDEANALRTVQSLQATMGPLTDDQKAAILATVQALRAEQRELDVLRQKNAKYVEALGSVKGLVEDATQAFVRGDLGQLIRSPGKLLDAFQTLQGRKIFDDLFGDAFRDLEDQVNGTSVVRDASDKMGAAVNKAAVSIGKLGDAAEAAAGRVANPGAAPTPGGATTDTNGDVVVTGKRDPIVAGIGKVGEKIAGLFTNPSSAKTIGQSIGNYAGKGLAGAATGSVVAGVSKALGVKLNSTGAQIGGAVGNFLPIPGGSIIGSIAGGLLGGLFGSKKDSGTATITGQNTTATATGTSRATSKAASSLAEAVQNGVASVAQQLGGELGRYNVSIGTYDGDYRVSTSGQTGELSFGKKNKSKSTLYDFGDDQAAAIAFAIQDAVKDGAVKGLSSAVQKALASSSDINKGLQEAINVRALETALGGAQSALDATFAAEKAAAQERLRLARTYGLDIVATEKLNAEQRSKLVDDTLKSRIGSLSSFLDQLKFGDLSEGSAVDKRNSLLAQIEKIRPDAEAGKEGAADQLATLYQQLVTNSRNAFGTAGTEYTSDRTGAQTAVERVIAMETDRVNQAAGITAAANATTAAVQQGNALANEANDLAARQLAATLDLSRALDQSRNSGSTSFDRSITGRQVSLV